jgi:hypothetical protein
METLREFIDRRLRELREAERPIRAQLNEIERERKELEKTAKMIGLESAYREDIDPRNTQKKTIKEAVMEILTEFPMGLTATDIRVKVNTRMNTSYKRSSLSPQLSRLKQDKRIKQEGIVWSLIAPEKKRAPIG